MADEAIGIVSLAVLTPPRIGSESRSTRGIGSESRSTRGDCVDCGLCVATCPTGIDIRDGLQLECIGCAQCIDACDAVMTKLKRPRGLIRYSSQAAVAGRPPRIVRARLVIYSIILTVLLAALALKLATRSPADVTVLRGLGAPFVLLDAGEVGNQVRVKIVNRTPAPVSYAIDAVGADGLRIRSERNPVTVAPGEAVTVPAMIVAPADSFSAGALRIAVRVRDGAGFEKDRPYRLLGPASPRPAGASQETER